MSHRRNISRLAAQFSVENVSNAFYNRKCMAIFAISQIMSRQTNFHCLMLNHDTMLVSNSRLQHGRKFAMLDGRAVSWMKPPSYRNGGLCGDSSSSSRATTQMLTEPFSYLVPLRKLWVVEGMLVGSASPDGTANCALATRIAVKSCACGAPLRGCGT
jgi:hypothetical protein